MGKYPTRRLVTELGLIRLIILVPGITTLLTPERRPYRKAAFTSVVSFGVCRDHLSKMRKKRAYNSDELCLSICVACKHTFEDPLAV
jgi:hypothetical protein